jgi:hypothetical protein
VPGADDIQWEERRSLPQEAVPALLELLDASGIASLRRASRLGIGLAEEARIAELRAKTLELLMMTKFPFTHAAFVLGLNGPYYSHDTGAENHYGIPTELPATICKLFREMVPGVAFTTIRMQRLSSAVNFGGKHRTLAFSLATPLHELPATELDETAADSHDPIDAAELLTDKVEPSGYALCLTAGCSGGRGEVREDIEQGSWRHLTAPNYADARWVPFSRSGWLQWHWPTSGDMYAIIVTCEPLSHRLRLKSRERRLMHATGFLLPERTKYELEREHEETTASVAPSSLPAAVPSSSAESSPSSRRSAAAVSAAMRILGLDRRDTSPSDEVTDESPSVSVLVSADEIEDAFRRTVRSVHPDRVTENADALLQTGDFALRTQGWAMSQVAWARKVLHDALRQASVDTAVEEAVAPAGEVLMLGAPI